MKELIQESEEGLRFVPLEDLLEALHMLRDDFMQMKRGYHVTIEKWIKELDDV